MPVRRALICLFACLFAALAAQPQFERLVESARSGRKPEKLKSHKAEETVLSSSGQGVVVTASLTRGRFSSGQISCPSWEVALAIRNHSASELELGETVAVIEKARGKDDFVGCFVARERADSAARFKRIKLRYAMDWGEEIDQGGSAVTLFVGSGQFVMVFSSKEPYEGLGYGRVSPRAERKISIEVPMPVKLRDAPPEHVIVVTPFLKPVDAAMRRAAYTVLQFSGEEPQKGQALSPLETRTVQVDPLELRKLAVPGADLWRRIFAMNWLAESAPEEAKMVLLEQLAAKDNPPLLRSSAAINLGGMKEKSAVATLIEVLQATDNAGLRQWTIDALGDIGASEAAPVVRRYLNDPNTAIAKTALKAAGDLKDAEAVPALLAVLSDKSKKDLRPTAADALVAINNPAAVQGLLGILKDPKNEANELAAERLGKAGVKDALGPLAEIARDSKARRELRAKALASLGQIGGAEAMTTLRSAADGDNDALRRAALEAFGKSTEPEALQALIQFAERTGYASREDAVRKLAESKSPDAAQAIRRITSDARAPAKVRAAACRGIRRSRDPEALPALETALGDADADLYREALEAMSAIGGPPAERAALAALQSRHEPVRREAASALARMKPAQAQGPVWEAYRAETKEGPGRAMADALIELKFSDKQAIPFLIGRLDPGVNKLWFSDARLLRHLTQKDFGPKYEWGDRKDRDAELARWREWWTTEGAK